MRDKSEQILAAMRAEILHCEAEIRRLKPQRDERLEAFDYQAAARIQLEMEKLAARTSVASNVISML